MTRPGDGSAPSEVTLQVPRPLDAWQRATIVVGIANRSADTPILPVHLLVSTCAGTLAEWSVEAGSGRWSAIVPACVGAAGVEILLVGSQQVSPEDLELLQSAAERFVRLEPVAPGERLDLEAQFTATYAHGDKVEAALTYITLDSQTQSICAAEADRSGTAFVACEPVSRVQAVPGKRLYMPLSDTLSGRRTAEASARLEVRRPSFDIDAARKRSGIGEGRFGYETATSSWLLVTADRRRTHRVAEKGEIEQLRGDWLDVALTAMAGSEATLSWHVADSQERERIQAALAAAAIPSNAFALKDHAEAAALSLTVDAATLPRLGHLLDRLGYSVVDFRIVREGSS